MELALRALLKGHGSIGVDVSEQGQEKEYRKIISASVGEK